MSCNSIHRMMLLTLFATATFMIHAQLYGTPDRCRELLQGPVHEVCEYSINKRAYFHADTLAKYEALGQKPPQFTRELSSVTTYDKRGNVIEKESYGFGASKDVVEYTDDGRRQCERRYRDGSLRRVYNYVYDNRNRLLSAEATNDEGVIFRESYTDTDTLGGHILRCSHVNVQRPGTGDSETTVIYSADGRMARMIQNSYKMQLDAEFDETEYPVRVLVAQQSQVTYAEYDPEANVKRSYLVGIDGQRTLARVETLDRYRNELSVTEYGPDGSVTGGSVCTYDYDQYGNWVRRVRTSADGTARVRIREIEYY